MKDIHGLDLDSIWMAEFRGFFFGEGYLGVIVNGKKHGKIQHTCRAQITLRDDDVEMLHDIHSKLGGLLHTEKRGRISKINGKKHVTRPYSVWRVTGKPDVTRVCDILELSVMPSKKRLEVLVLRKYLDTIGILKHGPRTKEKAELWKKTFDIRQELANELKRLHSYGK